MMSGGMYGGEGILSFLPESKEKLASWEYSIAFDLEMCEFDALDVAAKVAELDIALKVGPAAPKVSNAAAPNPIPIEARYPPRFPP